MQKKKNSVLIVTSCNRVDTKGDVLINVNLKWMILHKLTLQAVTVFLGMDSMIFTYKSQSFLKMAYAFIYFCINEILKDVPAFKFEGLTNSKTFEVNVMHRYLLSISFFQKSAPEFIPFSWFGEHQLVVGGGNAVIDNDIHPVAIMPELSWKTERGRHRNQI